MEERSPKKKTKRSAKTLAATMLSQSLEANESLRPHRRAVNDTLSYTDLDPRCWKDEHCDILLESLWLFPSRDKRGPHSGDYHGNFIPQIPNQVLRRYTKPGEVVLDLFSGSGTTLIEAANLGRHGIGVDLQQHANDMAQLRIEATGNPHRTDYRLITADSATPAGAEAVRKVLQEWGYEYAHHVILHPPYWDIIHFSSNSSGDLSLAESEEEFYEGFAKVVKNAIDLLLPGRFLTLVIGDKYSAGQWFPLGFNCMEVCRRQGMILKSLNVKDMQGNEKGKGSTTNLWKYRAMKGGFYLFKHEYVMIFQKPVPKKHRLRLVKPASDE